MILWGWIFCVLCPGTILKKKKLEQCLKLCKSLIVLDYSKICNWHCWFILILLTKINLFSIYKFSLIQICYECVVLSTVNEESPRFKDKIGRCPISYGNFQIFANNSTQFLFFMNISVHWMDFNVRQKD